MSLAHEPLLSVRGIEVLYDRVILALKGVSIDVPVGGIVALLGANGAGKSTTLKAVSGLLRAERGEIVAGSIRYGDIDPAHVAPDRLVREGLVQVLEGRHCFQQLTVEENLVSGALFRRPGRADLRQALERMYTRFPRLKIHRHKQAGYTSGGEQQMLAIGRALMAQPRLVLLDEPSMGLAPQIVEEIFRIVHELNHEDGVGFLVAEQNATLALRYARRGYVLENGRVAAEGSAAELQSRDDIKAFYLGVGTEGRRSFRGRAWGRPKRAAVTAATARQ